MKLDRNTPLAEEAAESLCRTWRQRGELTDGWVFPSPENASQPISRHRARDLVEETGVARCAPARAGQRVAHTASQVRNGAKGYTVGGSRLFGRLAVSTDHS